MVLRFLIILLSFCLSARGQGPISLATAGLGLCNPRSSLLENPAQSQVPGWQAQAFYQLWHALPELSAQLLRIGLSKNRKRYGLELRQYGLSHFRQQKIEGSFGMHLQENWSCGLSLSLSHQAIVEQEPQYFSQQRIFIQYQRGDWQWAHGFSHISKAGEVAVLSWNQEMAFSADEDVDLYIGSRMQNDGSGRLAIALEYHWRKTLFLRQGLAYDTHWQYAAGLEWNLKTWSIHYAMQWQRFLGLQSGIGLNYSFP